MGAGRRAGGSWVGSRVRVARMEQARGSGCKISPEISPARDQSDGYQIFSDGRYGAEEETRGGGEMN